MGHAWDWTVEPPPKKKARLYPRVPRHCLHLFSGPDRAGDVQKFLADYAWSCCNVDVVRKEDPDGNLLDDAVWERLKARIEGKEFGFVLAGTPCSTFSRAREHPPGPRVVRSVDHPTGLPGLSGEEKEEVRKANVLVDRTAEACRLVAEQGGGFAIETPEPWPDKPSLLLMPVILELEKRFSARRTFFDQCMLGAPSTKPTAILFHRGGFVTLRQRCDHERKWHVDPKGRQAFSSHPTIWGSRTAGVWKTNAAAQYPPALCRELARCIAVVQPVAASDEPRARLEIPAAGS